MEQNTPTTEEDFKRLALREAGVVYSATAVFPLVISTLIGVVLLLAGAKDYSEADWFKYLGFLIPQLCFAGIAVFFFRKTRTPVQKVYGGCKWYYFIIALVLQFGLLFSLTELNGYFVKLLTLMGYKPSESTLPSLDGWNLLPAILVIAVLPALFEETIFRGILSKQMHENGWGLVPTVLISGAMFSLFHHNPEQTLYQFVCGVCLTLVAIRAGSVLPTICAHFVNNALILILEATGHGTLSDLPLGGYISLIVVSALCLIGMLVYLVFFDKRGNRKGGVIRGKTFFLFSGIGIGVCAVYWLVVLIEGCL
ncbi:MAG: CPBP family intramembrane metalloprotease [Clostridia bacterium]|nr:CPBP family intramembrane metalloprotease [Clostridia bacterium]